MNFVGYLRISNPSFILIDIGKWKRHGSFRIKNGPTSSVIDTKQIGFIPCFV